MMLQRDVGRRGSIKATDVEVIGVEVIGVEVIMDGKEVA